MSQILHERHEWTWYGENQSASEGDKNQYYRCLKCGATAIRWNRWTDQITKMTSDDDEVICKSNSEKARYFREVHLESTLREIEEALKVRSPMG